MTGLSDDVKLTIEAWPLDDLITAENNNKTHTEESTRKLATSMSKLGQIQPVLAGSDKVIIAGHGRLLAARSLGWEKIKVIELPVDAQTARKMRIADNLVSNDNYDVEALSRELTDLVKDGDLDLGEEIDTMVSNERMQDLLTSAMNLDANMDMSALTEDASSEVERMSSENEDHMKEADDKPTTVSKVLGFNHIDPATTRRLKRALGAITSKEDPEGRCQDLIKWMEEKLQ